MALPNASYTVVTMTTLAKQAVLVSSGTIFGTQSWTRKYVPSSFWGTRAPSRRFVMNPDGRAVVTLPTLAKNAVINAPNSGFGRIYCFTNVEGMG